MFRFQNIESLYLLILIPILLLIYFLFNAERKKNMKKFADENIMMQDLSPEASISKPTLKFYLLLSALTIIILLIARPQFGFDKKEVKQKGIEFVVALDVSNSMNAKDQLGKSTSRLSIAKQIVQEIFNKLGNDQVGLIVFAGDANIQIPLTPDHLYAKSILDMVNTNSIARQGTAIDKAIEMSISTFGPEKETGRAILVISDGEDNEGNAIEAAKLSKSKGILVFTMGIGSNSGSPIPIPGTNSFIKNSNGEVVISKMNESMLKQISNAGGGSYVRGTDNTRSTANLVIDELGSITKKEMRSTVYAKYEEHFQFLAAIVLVLLLFELLILRGKSPLFKNFHLFK